MAARKRKLTENEAISIVAENLEEPVQENVQQVAQEPKSVVEEALAAVEIEIEHEIIKNLPEKRAIQKIYLKSGKVAISDLRVPTGVDPKWSEDKVITWHIKPETTVEVIIPNECDLNKWVKYYKMLSSLGLQVVRFGVEK